MERISSFLIGCVVGIVLCFVGLKYHVVQAEDGWHLVPKLSAQFTDAYVDIRGWSVKDWEQHGSLAIALMQAEKGHLLQNSASASLQQSIDHALTVLRNQQQK
jgi:hypothetical protein